MTGQAVLAIVIGCNLLLCLGVWHRARPGSIPAQVMPVMVLLMVAMLVGKLPRLFWPDAEGLHIAGTAASMIVTTGIVVMQIRRIVMHIRHQRGLRRGPRPA